jgi:hypothetical protein
MDRLNIEMVDELEYKGRMYRESKANAGRGPREGAADQAVPRHERRRR